MAARSRGVLVSLTQRWSALSSSVSRRKIVRQWELKRSCSGQSGEDSADAEKEIETSITSKLEQAIYEIRIFSAAPDWLPLFPGGSFWIHPDQIAERKPRKSSGPLLDPASEREIFALVMPMGWPSSTAASDALKPKLDPSS